jgi:hypothetical protein
VTHPIFLHAPLKSRHPPTHKTLTKSPTPTTKSTTGTMADEHLIAHPYPTTTYQIVPHIAYFHR